MARRKTITSERKLSRDSNGDLVRKDTVNVRYSNYNGQFVSSLFLIVVILMIIFFVFGAFKHEPIEMAVGVAQRVSNYGERFKGDLTTFCGAIDSIKRDETKTYTLYFQGHYIDVPQWFTQGFNGAVDIFKFVNVVPVAFLSLSLRFLWLLVDIIGFCLL